MQEAHLNALLKDATMHRFQYLVLVPGTLTSKWTTDVQYNIYIYFMSSVSISAHFPFSSSTGTIFALREMLTG